MPCDNAVQALQTSVPETVIEAAIQELHALLLQTPYGPCLAAASHAEWWAHCR